METENKEQPKEFKCPTPDEFLQEILKPTDWTKEYEEAKAQFAIDLQKDPNLTWCYDLPDGTKESYWMRRIRLNMGSNKYKYYTHSNVNKNLSKYLDKDCIIAYAKDIFFGVFIIKSKTKYFAFVCKDKELHLGGMGYSLMDTGLKQAIKVIENVLEKHPNQLDKANIAKPEEYQRMNNWVLAQAIAGD
jgi:hypothetical protein